MSYRGGGRGGGAGGAGRGGGRGGYKQRSMLHTGNGRDAGDQTGLFSSKLSRQSDAARKRSEDEAFDESMGFARLKEGGERIGYLFHMLPTVVAGDDRVDRAALDMYFIQQDGESFKGTILHEPYFYVACAGSVSGQDEEVDVAPDDSTTSGGGGGGGAHKHGLGGKSSSSRVGGGVAISARMKEVLAVLEKRYEGLLSGLAVVEKEDLEMLNHLSGE